MSYNSFRDGDQGVHHNSLGTVVLGNRGVYVSVGVYADSRVNLTQTSNVW